MRVVDIINKSDNPCPQQMTVLSAGSDLYANESVVLKPLQRSLVSTGIYMELHEGYEGQIRPRSGLAYKHGITVLNSPGTIDADYRGEIKVLLVNNSDKPFKIEKGERIAQIVIAKYTNVVYNEVEQLSDTKRGDNGFGSTGKK